MASVIPVSPIKESSDSQLQFRTRVSDGLSIQIHAAPILRRIAAYIIDLGVATIAVYGLMIVVFMLFFSAIAVKSLLPAAIGKAGVVFALGIFLVGFLAVLCIFDAYFIYFEYRTGTTPGKRLLGLKVVSLDGQRLTLSACVIRELARYIDCLMIFPGLLSISLTERRQRIGDLLVGSVVTYSKHEEAKSSFLYVSQDSYNYFIELLKPRPFQDHVSSQYLEFAFERYIKKNGSQAMKTAEKEWYALVQPNVDLSQAADLTTRDQMRFFAEFCFQQQLERRSQ